MKNVVKVVILAISSFLVMIQFYNRFMMNLNSDLMHPHIAATWQEAVWSTFSLYPALIVSSFVLMSFVMDYEKEVK